MDKQTASFHQIIQPNFFYTIQLRWTFLWYIGKIYRKYIQNVYEYLLNKNLNSSVILHVF